MARAGEHGKRFVVVATDVRTLAENEKQLSSQINALIHENETNIAALLEQIGPKNKQGTVRGPCLHVLLDNWFWYLDGLQRTIEQFDDIERADGLIDFLRFCSIR